MNKKHTIITVIITIVVVATAYLGYVFYNEIGVINQENIIVNQDHATLTQVVTYLNQATQQPTK